MVLHGNVCRIREEKSVRKLYILEIFSIFYLFALAASGDGPVQLEFEF